YNVEMHVAAQQPGFLYLINEGPKQSDGLPQYNLVYPLNGSSEIKSGKDIGTGWSNFDTELGTEKIWIIFSRTPIEQLEAAKKYANAQDLGEIKDQNDIKAIQSVIAGADKNIFLKRDDTNKDSVATGKTDPLVTQLTLTHE